MTLVEVMLSMGMLAMISLGVMKVMDLSGQKVDYTKSRYDVAMTMDSVAFELRKLEVCQNNFLGNAANNTYTSIVDGDSNPIFSTTQTFGDRNTITLSSISTELLASNTVDLVLNFTVANENLGVPNLLRRIRMYVGVDGSNNINNCFEVEENLDETVVAYGCLGTGGTIVGDQCYRRTLVSGSCEDWGYTADDVATQTTYAGAPTYAFDTVCTNSGAITDPGSCSGISYLVGFDGSGNKICTNLTATQVLHAFEFTNTVDCSSGDTFNIGYTNPYSVVCTASPAPPAPVPVPSPAPAPTPAPAPVPPPPSSGLGAFSYPCIADNFAGYSAPLAWEGFSWGIYQASNTVTGLMAGDLRVYVVNTTAGGSKVERQQFSGPLSSTGYMTVRVVQHAPGDRVAIGMYDPVSGAEVACVKDFNNNQISAFTNSLVYGPGCVDDWQNDTGSIMSSLTLNWDGAGITCQYGSGSIASRPDSWTIGQLMGVTGGMVQTFVQVMSEIGTSGRTRLDFYTAGGFN